MRELGIESSSAINSTYEAQTIRADEVNYTDPRYNTGWNFQHQIKSEREHFASNVLDIQALQDTV